MIWLVQRRMSLTSRNCKSLIRRKIIIIIKKTPNNRIPRSILDFTLKKHLYEPISILSVKMRMGDRFIVDHFGLGSMVYNAKKQKWQNVTLPLKNWVVDTSDFL